MLKKIKRSFRRRKFSRIAMQDENLMLDLGSGGPGRSGTLGIDLNPAADIIWDLQDNLPLPDNCVVKIFSDHFFEHLDPLIMLNLLKECRRVLKQDGILRFTVPHLDPYLQLYLEDNAVKLSEMIYDVPKDYDEIFDTAWGRISWLLYRNGEHRGAYDSKSIKHIVRLAGFTNVRQTSFNSDLDRNMRNSSIYIEAWN